MNDKMWRPSQPRGFRYLNESYSINIDNLIKQDSLPATFQEVKKQLNASVEGIINILCIYEPCLEDLSPSALSSQVKNGKVPDYVARILDSALGKMMGLEGGSLTLFYRFYSNMPDHKIQHLDN
jgi:hypothetical protein